VSVNRQARNTLRPVSRFGLAFRWRIWRGSRVALNGHSTDTALGVKDLTWPDFKWMKSAFSRRRVRTPPSPNRRTPR